MTEITRGYLSVCAGLVAQAIRGNDIRELSDIKRHINEKIPIAIDPKAFIYFGREVPTKGTLLNNICYAGANGAGRIICISINPSLHSTEIKLKCNEYVKDYSISAQEGNNFIQTRLLNGTGLENVLKELDLLGDRTPLGNMVNLVSIAPVRNIKYDI